MRAAAVVVVTARRVLVRAAPPREAEAAGLVHAAAGGALGARVVVVADGRGRGRGGGRRAGVRRVLAVLDRVRRLHRDPALTGGRVYIAGHPDVPRLPPRLAP